ncbi:hypothetical protein SLS62_001524 [Diatrype stigma]|uniref:Uncharacterized protein n=1 Tax=Diatrype stigma TaxID=117547 RepID=A0AAN9UXR5_9PEZI
MSEPIRNSAVDAISPAARVDSGIDVGDEPLPLPSHVETISPAARVDSGIDTGDEPVPPNQSETIEPAARVDSGVDVLEPLVRVDSAVQGLSSSPPKEKVDKASSRRKSSMVAGVAGIKDLAESKTPITVASETQGTGWKINKSSSTVEDKDILKKLLVTPAVRAIELHFFTGVVVTARNRTGVTIKDALDAIHSKNKKRSDEDLPEPYLKGFEWVPADPDLPESEKEANWDRLYIHLSDHSTAKFTAGGKKKNKKAAD